MNGNLLITFHPVTIAPLEPWVQIDELLAVLQRLDDTGLILTLPDADVGGRAPAVNLEEFADERVLRWRNRAREYTTKFREELMTPCPGTVCCPSE